MTDHEKILASKRKKLEDLDNANGETFNAIQKAVPDFAMDSTSVRLNMLIEALKKSDLFDEEYWLDFEIDFHTQVKEALEPMLARVQQHLARSRLSVVKKPTNKLVDGQGRPLRS